MLERGDRVAGVREAWALRRARKPARTKWTRRQGRGGGARPNAPAKSATAPAAAEGTTPPPPRNMLQWAIHASGPIGGFLLLLSIYFTALVIRLFMEFRVSEAVPTALVDKLEAAIRDKKFQDAYDVCKDNDSLPGPAGADRHRQPAQRPYRGQGGHAGGHRGDGDHCSR